MAQDALGARVLVVDDERLIADTLALILKQHGFQATAVYSGEAAVDAAETLQPNAVVADVIMGGMNGIELAIHIFALHPGCRVILFSGQFETIDLLAAAERRGRHFEILTKPFTLRNDRRFRNVRGLADDQTTV